MNRIPTANEALRRSNESIISREFLYTEMDVVYRDIETAIYHATEQGLTHVRVDFDCKKEMDLINHLQFALEIVGYHCIIEVNSNDLDFSWSVELEWG